MTAVSWYASMVVQDFYNPLYVGARSVTRICATSRVVSMRFLSCVFVCRFELGVGLYLGWGASCLSVLGGGLLCSACKRASPAGHKRYGTNTHCELTLRASGRFWTAALAWKALQIKVLVSLGASKLGWGHMLGL